MSKSIAFAIALALAAGIPVEANSGGAIITAHPLSFSMKLVEQSQASNGDDRAAKDTIDVKEVFEECRGAPPTNTEKIYLFINCQTPTTNSIVIIDTSTNPVSGIETLGQVTFNFDHAIQVESNDALKQRLIPVTINLQCNGGATDLDLTGVVDLKLAGGIACPDSGKITFTGTGISPSVFGNFLLNKDSSITIGKRSSTITGFPVF